MIEFSECLKKFPPYLFAEIDKKKAELRKQKVEFIDVSIGDPDICAPETAVETLTKYARIKANQKYALDQGSLRLREAIKFWTKKRFNVSLDQNSEILPLLGSKEGLIHFAFAFLNRGEYLLVPSPGYPGYKGSAYFTGAKIHYMPLLESNRFLPDLDKIPQSVRNKAKIMYLNYPNNPTTAIAPKSFLEKAVRFCAEYGIILAYDNAYSEIYFDKRPLSILEIKGAKDVAIEFHSFSKTFCMTGYRLGWAAGNRQLVSGLLKVKANIDSGIFGAIQETGSLTLEKESEYVQTLRKKLKERRDLFVSGLEKIGFESVHADSTFYVWARIPKGFKSSIDFAEHLLSKKRIVATPGVGFGKYGEGFIRFALTVDVLVLKQALKLLE
ncbi:MAG: aminotransferase class I/II-fold pyridoxal phosphate-dependent enzyme [Candidatus Omnitrophica bacterium]|nr:aminotransferase class I/II-fold pyridoxal phosphate-dependent enzyme [Candidatus Omnitrophota bacterium]